MSNIDSGGERFGDYQHLRVLAGGIEEDLLLVRHSDGSRYAAKRATLLFRGDPTRNEARRAEYRFLTNSQIPGLARPREIVAMGDEEISIMYLDPAVTLEEWLDNLDHRRATIPLEVRLALLAQLVQPPVLIEQRRLESRQNLPDLCLDYRPGSISLSPDGICRYLHAVETLPPALHHTIGDIGADDLFTFAAPEQITAGAEADFRATWFGFGVLVFRIVTGKNLFSNTSNRYRNAITRRKLRGLHPAVSDVCSDLGYLDSAVFKLLANNPGERNDGLLELADGVQQQVDQTRPADPVREFNQSLVDTPRPGPSTASRAGYADRIGDIEI